MLTSGIIIAIVVSVAGLLVTYISAMQAYRNVKKDTLDKIRRTRELLANDKSYSQKKFVGR
jgi:hypothetical protein